LPGEQEVKNFFTELKRRNVYKVAIAYAVVAWLLIQIATQTFPFFDIPNWAVRLVLMLLALGFPVALILAWAFELTPEGIRRSDEIESAKSKGRAWIYIAIIAAALSIGLFFLGRFTASTKPSAPGEAPSKSIAVLPFENLSANQENAFFTDGVQDEILTDLAKVADLKVISRTSVMQYKATAPRNLSEIAQALKVANVLEGSVQRSGNRVRVSAQLIDARTDSHIWAENYDRDLSDVFTIQSEIAQAITDQLRAKLSPQEKAAMDQQPTTDMTAYDLYLKAKRLRDEDTISHSHERKNVLEAIELLNEAVKKDPNFLLAWCLLASAHDFLYFDFDQTPQRLALAEASVKRAESLQPDASETHLAKGIHYYTGYRDYNRARQELLKARRLLPNSSLTAGFLGYIARRQGRWDEAVAELTRAVELDPYGGWIEDLGLTYTNLRRYDEAAAVYDRGLAQQPKSISLRELRATIEVFARGDMAPLRSTINSISSEGPSAAAEISEGAFACALRERDGAAADRAVAEMKRQANSLPFQTALGEGLAAQLRHDESAAHAAFVEARAEAERLVKAQPKNSVLLRVLSTIDAALGNKKEAIEEARAACALSPLEEDALEGAVQKTSLASVYAMTGEHALALQELSEVSKLPGGPSYGELKLDPWWDSLRDQPEFQKILAFLAPKTIK
jgi:TolB-like protein/Tfp pilus assembly protein PilF